MLFLDDCAAHVHFEQITMARSLHQAQMLRTRARQDSDVLFRQSRVNQKCRRASRPVARHLHFTAIRIEEPNASVTPFRIRADNEPAVRAHTRVAVADCNGRCIQLEVIGLRGPGKQEIVLGAVRLGEGNFH